MEGPGGKMGYKVPANSGLISIVFLSQYLYNHRRYPTVFKALFVRSSKLKMSCRIQYYGCFVLVAAILLIFALGTDAQLNFSTGWGGGKRSQMPQAGGGNAMCSSQGKPSLNQLLALYSLIQNEAQKMLDCQKFAK